MSLSVSRTAFQATRPARSVVKAHASLMQKVGVAAASVALSAGLAVAPAFAAGVSFDVKNGATVSSPVHLEFSVDGMTVKPAAEGVVANTGHFHVLVDDASVPAEGEAIPFDEVHLHYGKGQTSADVPLTPGKHKLTLQFANAVHESYGSTYAKTITVNVK